MIERLCEFILFNIIWRIINVFISRKKGKGFFALLISKYFNNPYIFPNLSLYALRRYADRWAQMFSDIPIMSIKLYHKQPQYYFKISSIYAVVFEIDPKINLLIETNPEIRNKYNSFCGSHGWLWTADNIEEFDVLGINHSFFDVYKEKPSNNDFMKNWFFISKVNGNVKDEDTILNMKVMTDEPHWVLYRTIT